MAQKIYVVEGRKFRTEADYQNALKDQQEIENLRVQTKKMSLADQKKLLQVIRSGRTFRDRKEKYRKHLRRKDIFFRKKIQKQSGRPKLPKIKKKHQRKKKL